MRYRKIKLLGIILLTSLILTIPVQAQIIDFSHTQLEFNVQKGDSMTYEITSAQIANNTTIQDYFMYANKSGFAYNVTKYITYTITITNINHSTRNYEQIFMQYYMSIPGEGSYYSGIYGFPAIYNYELPLSIGDLLYFNLIIPVSNNKSTILRYFKFIIPGSNSIGGVPRPYNDPSSDVTITNSSISLTFSSYISDTSNGPITQITSYDSQTGWLKSSNMTFGNRGRTSNITIKRVLTNASSFGVNLAIQFINFEGPILILAVIAFINLNKRKFREFQGYTNSNISFRTFMKQKYTKKFLNKPQPKIHAKEVIRQVEEILKENE